MGRGRGASIPEDTVKAIIENRSKLSPSELAKMFGIARSSVYRILKEADETPSEVLSDTSEVVATVPTQSVEPAVKETVSIQSHLFTTGRIVDRMELASTMTDQLSSEVMLYHRAVKKAQENDDKSAMIEALAHQKAIHGIADLLGRWMGMDRVVLEQTVRKNITDEDLRKMSLTELLALKSEQ